jgi:HSP20 family molecular chaperone IbpA
MSTQVETQQSKAIGNRVERASNRPVLVPAVDICETQQEIVITADMPGVDESSVDVTLEQDVLTLEGRLQMPAPSGYELGFQEFGLGDYRRVFTLATEVNRDGIAAKVKNGVLRLVLPKAEPAKAKKIPVKAG